MFEKVITTSDCLTNNKAGAGTKQMICLGLTRIYRNSLLLRLIQNPGYLGMRW